MSYLKDMPRLSYWFQKEDERYMEQSQMVPANPSLGQLTPSFPSPRSPIEQGKAQNCPVEDSWSHEDEGETMLIVEVTEVVWYFITAILWR